MLCMSFLYHILHTLPSHIFCNNSVRIDEHNLHLSYMLKISDNLLPIWDILHGQKYQKSAINKISSTEKETDLLHPKKVGIAFANL